jgi:hypothetical protein
VIIRDGTLRTLAEHLELDRNHCKRRRDDAGGDHAQGGLHRRSSDEADAIQKGAQITNFERSFISIEVDICRRLLCTFLGCAGQDGLKFGIGHAHEGPIGSAWCHFRFLLSARMVFQPIAIAVLLWQGAIRLDRL